MHACVRVTTTPVEQRPAPYEPLELTESLLVSGVSVDVDVCPVERERRRAEVDADSSWVLVCSCMILLCVCEGESGDEPSIRGHSFGRAVHVKVLVEVVLGGHGLGELALDVDTAVGGRGGG